MTPIATVEILAIKEGVRNSGGEVYIYIFILYEENGEKKLNYFERWDNDIPCCDFISSNFPETCGSLKEDNVSIESENPPVYKVSGYDELDDIYLHRVENGIQYLLEKYHGYIGELNTIL